jgi:phage replication O-like protein O
VAKPELEDGYTQIEHEVLEKLARTSLAPNQWRVLIFIIRKTCGWHKEVDYIANFQIVEGTGLCKAVVSRCLKGLSDLQLITRKGKSIGFQKDWEKWRELAKPSTSEKLAIPSTKLAIPSTELAESSTKVSSCAVTQKIKDTISKDTIQNIRGPSPYLGAGTPASKYLFEKTGRKRWQNLVQKEQFEKAESEVGEARMKEAVNWALTSGISNIKSIITAARREGETHGRARENRRRPKLDVKVIESGEDQDES